MQFSAEASLAARDERAPAAERRLSLQVDDRGRILERPDLSAEMLDQLVPALDAAALPRLFAAAQAMPGGRLRIDAKAPDGQAIAVWVNADEGAGYRAARSSVTFLRHGLSYQLTGEPTPM
jgi:hypothetical protein